MIGKFWHVIFHCLKKFLINFYIYQIGVRKISIIPRGIAGGYTKTLSEDKDFPTRSYIKGLLAMLLGGRTAEELIFNEMTTGARDDIKRATDIARSMVTNLGMSDVLGPRTFGQKEELVFLGREISEQKDYGDKIADLIDEEVNKIIQQAHEAAKRILTENKGKLIQNSQKLIGEETLEGENLEALFKKPPRKSKTKATTTATPVPIEPVTESEPAPKPKPKKAPAMPHPLPEQAPAASD